MGGFGGHRASPSAPDPNEPPSVPPVNKKRILLLAAGVLAAIVGVIVIFGSIVSLTRTGPTEVAVIRNGGWLDDKSIRTTIDPESSYSIPGIYSETRMYPAGNEQRFYRIDPDPNKADDENTAYVEVPTKDGIYVKLAAQTGFFTNFTVEDEDGKQVANDEILRKFDAQFGNREFGGKKVYDGGEGWSNFLDSQIAPLLVNTIREEISDVQCAELVSSCALIDSGKVPVAAETPVVDTKQSFDAISAAVNERLEAAVEQTLGEPYIKDVKFTLVNVELPDQIKGAIDEAQSAFAGVSQSQAELQQAQFEAQRLKELAEQYAKSPQLAFIEAVKEAPEGATIIIGESGFDINQRP